MNASLMMICVVALIYAVHSRHAPLPTEAVCVYSDGGNHEVLKKCPPPETNPKHSRQAVGCFALFNGTSIIKDCWTQQEISFTQCNRDICLVEGRRNKNSIFFCCCIGDECNADVKIF